jgi:hypothetical protein
MSCDYVYKALWREKGYRHLQTLEPKATPI